MTPLDTFLLTLVALFIGGWVRSRFPPGPRHPRRSPPPTKEEIAMAVFAELQQPLADLQAAVDELPAKVAATVAAGDPAAAADKADTISAVQSGAAAAVAAINAIGAAT